MNSLHFSCPEVRDGLLSLDIYEAKGPDRISNALLRNLAESLNVFLHLIFNTIANKCYFPKTWKVTKVVPIFKKGDRQMISNYWPINLFSAVSKVIGKLKNKKCIHHYRHSCHTQNIVPENNGPQPVTSLSLHELFNCFHSPDCNYLVSFYVDFQNAFDKVNHLLLLEKLFSPGVHG